jgi:ribonuclease P protein component
MLPRKYRLDLRHQPDFFIHARRVFSPAFTVFYQNTADRHEQTLVAIIVPKTTAAKATQRNYLKRVLSEELRLLLPHSTGKQIAVVVKKTFGKEELEKLKNLLISLR